MALVKKIIINHSITAATIYCIVKREVDGYLLNDANGAFAASPADPYVFLTEDSVIKGRYALSESRTVWNNGQYIAAVYQQSGGSPSPAADNIVGSLEKWIISDADSTTYKIQLQTDKMLFDVDSFMKAVLAYPEFTVVFDGSNGASQFHTNRTESDDDYWANGPYVQFTSGNNIGQTKKIDSYTGVGGVIFTTYPFTNTPAPGDTGILINR